MTFAFGKGFSWSLVAGRWSLVLGPWSLVSRSLAGKEQRTKDKGQRALLASRFWFLASGFSLLASGFWFPAQAQTSPDLTPYLGQPIAKVEIFYGGAPLTGENAALADLIGINPGDPVRLAVVQNALVRLYQSGQAANVVVTAQGLPAAPILRFEVTPQPRVSQVLFQGVDDEIKRDLSRQVTQLVPDARATQGRLDRAAEKIVEYYHQLGYFEAQAIPGLSLDANGREAIVTFRVTPGQQATVADIRFEGELKIDASEILSKFHLERGDPYSGLRLQEDLQRLRELHIEKGYLGYRLGTPRIERDIERNAVTIMIPIDSGPPVEIRIEGFSLSEDRKRQIFPSLQFGGIDAATLEEGRISLLNDLQRRGHFFAEVNFDPPQSASDRQAVVYRVDAGRKYNLREIRIEGTDAVTYEEIKNRLESRLGGFLNRGLTSQGLIKADQRVIEDFLRARGYLNARVQESRSAVALNREDLIIIHVVEPGPRSSIAEVLIQGNAIFSDEDLRREIRIAPHQPLSRTQVGEDAARLAAFYNTRGYFDSTVEAQIELLENETSDVRVVFNIREGELLSIHRILFRGNQRTREGALRNYLTFHEGDLLTTGRLVASEQNLYTTSGFRRVVIETEPAGVGSALSDRRNVVVEMVEAPRLLLTYGGGFRTDDGPRGLFEITNTNLLGRLYTGSFRLRASRREQLGQLSFTNPRPLGYKWPTLLSAFFQREERDAFDASRTTGLIQTERTIGTVFSIFRYSYSNVVISDVTEREQLRRQDSTVQIGRLSASFLLDRRDALFEPRRGDYTSIDLSLASSYFGGNENFFRFFGEHQRYYQVPVLPETVFAMNLRLGLAIPYGRSDLIPISERFFAGGSTTLRGFRFEEAGPRGPAPDDPTRTQPLGGDALAVFNAELRFPIWKRFGVSGAAFYDGGNVFLPFSKIRADAIRETRRNFTNTVGFGLRVKTPVGPVRLDFGVLLTQEPLVPRTKFHISFGPPF